MTGNVYSILASNINTMNMRSEPNASSKIRWNTCQNAWMTVLRLHNALRTEG